VVVAVVEEVGRAVSVGRYEKRLLVGCGAGTLAALILVLLMSWAGFSSFTASVLMGGLGACAGMAVAGRVAR
jgi:hypothetical protein